MRKFLVFMLMIATLSGCATRPDFRTEIFPLPISAATDNESRSKAVVLIFNASDPLFYGMNSDEDKMDIKLDGKGVVQLKNGQYAYFLADFGPHILDLYHWDIFNFPSRHEIQIESGKTVLEVCTVVTTNKARMRERVPELFETSFTYYDEPRASWMGLLNLPYFKKGFSEERRVQTPGSYFCSW